MLDAVCLLVAMFLHIWQAGGFNCVSYCKRKVEQE